MVDNSSKKQYNLDTKKEKDMTKVVESELFEFDTPIDVKDFLDSLK